jgi:hypothetical protein
MKNKFNLIPSLFLLALCVSCKKQLNLLPTDSFPPDKAFASVADLQKGLEGVYEENTGSYNKVYIGSILADEVKTGNDNIGQGQLSFRWEYTANDALQNTEYLSDFAAYYSMIDAINKELASIGNVTPKNDNETTQKKRINAELIALRGIAHFEVLTRFISSGYNPDSLGVPIMLRSDILAQPARATEKEVIAQVRADLATARAEKAIPDAPDDVTRLNQATIAAYQARVALLTGSWDSVINYAGDALRLSGKALVDRNHFAGYWLDSNEVETLWKYRNQVKPQTYWSVPPGYVYFSAASKLVHEFDESGNDIRFNTWITVVNNPSSADSFLINKYPGSANAPQVNDLKLVRVAELYLDLAEGYAQKGNLTFAKDTLNLLRESRILNNPDVSLTAQNAIPTILDERYKELCFEGFRFFDLKRNALPVSRLLSDAGDPKWKDLLASDYRFALPIPQHEMFANKNMVQNPGYY